MQTNLGAGNSGSEYTPKPSVLPSFKEQSFRQNTTKRKILLCCLCCPVVEDVDSEVSFESNEERAASVGNSWSEKSPENPDESTTKKQSTGLKDDCKRNCLLCMLCYPGLEVEDSIHKITSYEKPDFCTSCGIQIEEEKHEAKAEMAASVTEEEVLDTINRMQNSSPQDLCRSTTNGNHTMVSKMCSTGPSAGIKESKGRPSFLKRFPKIKISCSFRKKSKKVSPASMTCTDEPTTSAAGSSVPSNKKTEGMFSRMISAITKAFSNTIHPTS